jgi:hypothetical protein
VPLSALSPVSPEIARAAAAPFSGGAWIASAAFLLPVLVLTALLDEAIRGVEAEGRRRVLSTGVFLIQLAAAAGTVAVHVRRARDRIENSGPGLGALARWWTGTIGMTSGLCAGFLVLWVALGGAIESLSEVPARPPTGSGTLGLLRIVPLALATVMAAVLAALALGVAWLSAIRAVEGCRAGPAASILRGLWAKSRSRLLLHGAVAAAATAAAWVGMNAVVGAIYDAAGAAPARSTAASILYDDALRMWLVWTPPLAVLGSAGVASYLLLRPLNNTPPP